MKITIKTNDMKFKIPIYIPLSLGAYALKHVNFKNKNISESIENIDMKVLSESLYILKEYKGLTIVDVKAADGTEVKIKI